MSNPTAPATEPLLQPGELVRIVGKHPWAGSNGTLVSYGPYGLAFLKLEGWYVRLSENKGACYAKHDQVKRVFAA